MFTLLPPSAAQAQAPARYALVDGTVVVGTGVSADETTVTVQTAAGLMQIPRIAILSAQPATGPLAYAGPQTSQAPVSAGWAGGAAVLGFIGAGALLIGAGAAAATIDDADTSIAIGGATTLLGAVLIPIVALGGGSADGARGLPGLRTAGWMGYGLALIDAIVLLNISIGGGRIEPALTIGVGVLGGLSAVSFAVDALSRASEARARMGQASLIPVLGAVRSFDGRVVPSLGVRIGF